VASIAVVDKNSLGMKKVCPNMTNLLGKYHDINCLN